MTRSPSVAAVSLCLTLTAVVPGSAAHAGGLSLSGLKDAAEAVVTNQLLPISEENKLGKKLAAETEKTNTLHPDKAVQSYVEKVGKKVAARAKDTPKGIRFTFKVIKDDATVNAFALPGGHIYVYSGLLKLADDEAELASVLGHEIAHVTQRHVAERLIAQLGMQNVVALAAGTGGDIGQVAAQLAGTGAMLSFSREQESDADAKGLPYAVAAGYDPEGFVRLFNKLKKGEGPGFLVLLQNHPLPSDRIEAVQAQIKKLRKKPETRNEDAYRAMQRKL